MPTSILAIFPNQLFENHPGLQMSPDVIALLEDSLFFGDRRYPARFHRQKLWLLRASMKRYEGRLRERGLSVTYIDYDPSACALTRLLHRMGPGEKLITVDPIDFVLSKRLARVCQRWNMKLELVANPNFINRPGENAQFRALHKRWHLADFYRWQRRRLGILMNGNRPLGNRWSFDQENRKKLRRSDLARIPQLPAVRHDGFDHDARDYVMRRFPDHPGRLDTLIYPTSHQGAAAWLDRFLTDRLERFGDFQDAMEPGESWLWHSVLTPMLNIGLLSPTQVVEAALRYAESHSVPLNSLEGFVRQLIGWREYIRATYEDLGVHLRTSNQWQHYRPMPQSFYHGTTGIAPIDDTIARILATGYCHHIERLMVLGGFMFLCEIHPDAVYRWFMEMFVDSYDWVMVPNVYGMSQHAAGGVIATKPYFCGSAYIRRMSHYPVGSWCEIWDGLYWRWLWRHRDQLSCNPRWAMMCLAVQRMPPRIRQNHLQVAEAFLAK